MENDDSIDSQSEYIEARFKLNEWMQAKTKEQLIRYVNHLINVSDWENYPMLIGSLEEAELEYLSTEENEQEEEENNE